MSKHELREKLRHLTSDPGSLGSAVCALLKAAEADFPVMVMPDESRAILAQLAPQEEEWRSVTDSLPKPGTGVMASYRDTAGRWLSVRAMYAAARSVACTCDIDGDCLCEVDDTGESWWPEGWYEIADVDGDVSAWRIEGTVTHWMPLPTPPDEKERRLI